MALEISEIQDILKRVVAGLKPFDNQHSHSHKHKDGCPDFYHNYCTAIEYMDRIAIHAEIGKFPEKLFAERSPNQTEKEAHYVKKNYKQVTLPVFVDYLSTVTRPFHDSNWSINYQEDESKYQQINETLQGYLEGKIKNYGSLENFIKFIVPAKKAVDANGVIAIKPHIVFTEEVNGELEIDTQRLNEPIPYYYSSKQVVAWRDDEYAMIHLNEKCSCKYSGQDKQVGHIFEFYDDENIYIIRQVGNFIDYKFEIKLYFNHNWKKLPVIKLMGIPQLTQHGILWQSPFLFVTDILDLIILNHSNLQISINMCVYPYRIMYGDVCEFSNDDGIRCNGGKMITKDGREYSCPDCQGSGLKSRVSPMGTMLLKPQTTGDAGDSTFTQPPMQFVSPEISTLQFLRDKIAEDEMKARKMMHLHTSNSIVKGSEDMTATGMSLDLKALYAFVKTISDQTFFIYEFIIDAIGFMRYGEDYKKPVLVYPVTFDFTTEQDYIIQLKEAVTAGLPPFVIHSIIYRYLQTLYFNEQTTALVFNLIVKTDRLLTLSNEEIALKMSRGTVAKWEEILHTSAINFVDQLKMRDPKFFENTFEEQQRLLIEMAKAKALEISGAVSIPQNNVNNILNEINAVS